MSFSFWRSPPRFACPPVDIATDGVCQFSEEEDSGALVRGAHVRSAKLDGRASVSERREGVENTRESRSCPADVFPEDETGSDFLDDADELKEESAAGAVEAGPVASDGEVLTRASASDAIHDATPGAAVEGADIRPDRRRSQSAFFHARRQDFAGEGFPLHVNDRSSASNNSVDSEVESRAAGKEAENVEGVSHTPPPSAQTARASRAGP
jgi:hypothetical protein